MARGGWITAITAALCAGLGPGCALFGHRPASDGGCQVKHPVEPPPTPQPLEITNASPEPAKYLPNTDPPPRPAARAVAISERRPEPKPARGADEPQEHTEEHPATAAGPDHAPHVTHEPVPTPPQDPDPEPLLAALACFLKDQPDRALDLLKTYQRSSQDVYIGLLPVLAQLTHKGVDQLTPEEASVIDERLHGLAEQLRPRARLVIDKVCFCEHIDGYGQYRCLPEGHTFRARSGEQSGEPVLLYVELRNFAVEPCPQGFVTRLASSVEIRDAAGKQQWYHSFEHQEPPLYRQAPWHDCFGNYRFYMPYLPPGDYTLTITIRDLTRPGATRRDSKSLPLRVG